MRRSVPATIAAGDIPSRRSATTRTEPEPQHSAPRLRNRADAITKKSFESNGAASAMISLDTPDHQQDGK